MSPDFGPFNLGMTHHFCERLQELLLEPRLSQTTIVYYTTTAPQDITNAIFLLGSFMVARLGATPEQAWAPFSKLSGVVKPYRDATWCASPYDLRLLHCFEGLYKAIKTGLYHPETFDEAEYFYCECPRASAVLVATSSCVDGLL